MPENFRDRSKLATNAPLGGLRWKLPNGNAPNCKPAMPQQPKPPEEKSPLPLFLGSGPFRLKPTALPRGHQPTERVLICCVPSPMSTKPLRTCRHGPRCRVVADSTSQPSCAARIAHVVRCDPEPNAADGC